MAQEIKGLKELKKALKQIPQKLQDKAVSGGLRAAATVLAKEARKQIAASDLSIEGKKILRRAIRTKSSRSRKKIRGYLLGSVIILSGKENQARVVRRKDGSERQVENADAWWWRLVERGTSERFRDSGGSTGSVRARNIFKAAFDRAGAGAIDIGAARMREIGQKEIDKMGTR